MSTKKTRQSRALILNAGQREAVYAAMCALNQVGGFMSTTIMKNGPDHLIGIRQQPSGQLEIIGNAGSEVYASQREFAEAYGLNPDALTSDRIGEDRTKGRAA